MRIGPSTALNLSPLSFQGLECVVGVTTEDVVSNTRIKARNDFLLVTRERSEGWIHHWLLLLDFRGVLAERVTTVSLSVPETQLSALAEACPRKRRFILA